MILMYSYYDYDYDYDYYYFLVRKVPTTFLRKFPGEVPARYYYDYDYYYYLHFYYYLCKDHYPPTRLLRKISKVHSGRPPSWKIIQETA